VTLITARDPRGCYGCGGSFARREWPVLDKRDHRWHMVCFIRDDSAKQDPAVAPEHRRRLVLPGILGLHGKRRVPLS
jgi:hypothetical protein